MPKALSDYIYKVYNAFQGELREWCIRYSSGWFSKRYRTTTAEALVNIFSSLIKTEKPYELHFSIQKFLEDRAVGWSFIIDIDSADAEDKNYGYIKICNLLNKFNIFYLTDTRKHIWIPDWETSLIDCWNEMYGNEDFVKSLETYIKSTCELENIELDTALWKDYRHLIRVPYSIHLKSMKSQTFKMDIDTALQLWTGEKVDNCRMTTLQYAENFKNFIHTACKYGNFERVFSESDEHITPVQEKGYDWIERLLEKGVDKGFRRLALWLIITPYLVTVKELDRFEVEEVTSRWLSEKCKASRHLDRDLYSYAPSSFNYFKTRRRLPHKLDYIKRYYPSLFTNLVKVLK